MDIRTLEESDAPLLFALVEKNRQRLRKTVPWLDLVATEDETRSFIQNAQVGMANHTEVTLGIWDGDALAGVIALNSWNAINKTAAIGYWLSAEYEGQGVITDACKTLCGYAFDELDINRIELRCGVANPRSAAVAERLGFSFEGVSRESENLYGTFIDQNVYALLKRDRHTLTDEAV